MVEDADVVEIEDMVPAMVASPHLQARRLHLIEITLYVPFSSRLIMPCCVSFALSLSVHSSYLDKKGTIVRDKIILNRHALDCVGILEGILQRELRKLVLNANVPLKK